MSAQRLLDKQPGASRPTNGASASDADTHSESSRQRVLEFLDSRGGSVESEDGRPLLRVVLKYAQGGTPVIRELKRVSTPGLRKYVGVTEIPRVRNGLGMAILSTSQGVLSDRQARTQRTGGELLALVW